MASNVDYFLKHTLGEDFEESLQKTELWKQDTKTTLDHEELRTALQIVPRTIMALLIRELAPLEMGHNHKVHLPLPGNPILYVTKHSRDVYSGEIVLGSKSIVDFKYRPLPGIGLIIMSTFELYDMENLLSQPQNSPINDEKEDISEKVQKMVDDRLALHDLIGKVVDKKIMEKDAVHQLVMRKLTEMMAENEKIKDDISSVTKIAKSPGNADANEYLRGMANGLEVANATVHHKEPEFIDPPKKKRPLNDFLEKKLKKREYSVVMAKGENIECDTCGKKIFNNFAYSGCICMGDNMDSKIFVKKEKDGVKIRFSKGWDEENIELLLEVLRKKNGRT